MEDRAQELEDMLISERQYLTFSVKNEQFGITVLAVKEILEYTFITRVPDSQPYIIGITNVRGNIIPVIDLSLRLELGECELSESTSIIIVEVTEDNEEHEIGLLVDSIDQIYDIHQDDTKNVPELGVNIKKKFIDFMGKIEYEFVSILNLNTLLTAEELSQVYEVGQ